MLPDPGPVACADPVPAGALSPRASERTLVSELARQHGLQFPDPPPLRGANFEQSLAVSLYAGPPSVRQSANAALLGGAAPEWSDFARELICGIRALPLFRGDAFRAVGACVAESYRLAPRVCWGFFASLTRSKDAAQRIIERAGEGTLFHVSIESGRALDGVSRLSQTEVVLEPNAEFRVSCVVSLGRISIVSLAQVPTRAHLVQWPPQQQSSAIVEYDTVKWIEEERDAESIAATMRSFPGNVSIQVSGCNTLRSLADSGSLGSISVAIEVCVGALQTTAVIDICNCLVFIAVPSEYKLAISREGGINAIVQALRQHADSAIVAEKACCALQNLSSHPDNKSAIAMTSQQPGIKCWWSASKNLTINERNQEVVASEGGIQVIVDAMSAHVSSADVIHKACGVLRNLSTCTDYKLDICSRLGGMRKGLSDVDALLALYESQ
eukprot:m51a1_g11852 hypothetical protein (442) ;mRNA; r:490323-493233